MVVEKVKRKSVCCVCSHHFGRKSTQKSEKTELREKKYLHSAY